MKTEYSLSQFVKDAWPIVEPSTPYIHKWHIDFIAKHLEAVTEGKIKRLVVNEPEGTMKSLLFNVFWPAWEWLHKPQTKVCCITSDSYNFSLQKRDTLKFNRLVSSDWYKTKRNLNIESKNLFIKNESGGCRYATTMQNTLGISANRIIIDDPHKFDANAKSMKVDNDYFFESVQFRLEPEGSIVIVMTRLDENDLTGAILAANQDFEIIRLPMEYDPSIKRNTSPNMQDQRTQDGELLFEGRTSRVMVELW